MRVHPTAYLEHYADLYADNMLHRHGVTLDQYLADPDRYEHLLHQPFPLMPEQTRVRVTLMRAEIQEQTEQELQSSLAKKGGAHMEPMRHHRYPKKRGRLSAFRPAHNPFPQAT